MPKPRHPLELAVREAIANNPDWGPARIRDYLTVQLAETGRSSLLRARRPSLPSESTIGRVKRDFPADEHRPYRFVKWPETFENGGLPWEAAPSVRRLLADNLRRGFGRPPTQLAYWFWRIEQTIQLSVDECRPLAALIWLADQVGGEVAEGYRRKVETVLWRGFATGEEDLDQMNILHMHPTEQTLTLSVQGWRESWPEA